MLISFQAKSLFFCCLLRPGAARVEFTRAKEDQFAFGIVRGGISRVLVFVPSGTAPAENENELWPEIEK
jgi:hypothetical protein